MSTARTKSDPEPAWRASDAEPPELDAKLQGAAAAAAASATVASSGFDVGAPLIAVNSTSCSTNEARAKHRKCQHHADQRQSQQRPRVHSDTRKPDARTVFTAPWTCLDDPASLRPLARDSTSTAELVPGALLDYTGTTTRVDLICRLLPYIRNTYLLVPR